LTNKLKKSKRDVDKKFRILIISLSGMGDVLLFTPALHILRKRLPNVEITMLVKSNAAAHVLIGNSDIDHVQVFDPKSASIYKNFKFYMKERRDRYDISISAFPALTALNNLSTWVIGAKHRWTYRPVQLGSFSFLQNHTIPYNHGLHRVIYNMQLIEDVIKHIKGKPSDECTSTCSIDVRDIKLHYYISPEEMDFAQSFLQTTKPGYPRSSHAEPYFIGIHPGSASDQPFKRWPEEKFASLASILQTDFGAEILIFGGPEELPIAERIAKRMIRPPIILSGKIKLRQTAALMKYCRLFISNDSGLMHLAVAVGTQVVGIFGPTDDINTAPVGSRDRIVFLPDLSCKTECRKRFLFDKHCRHQYRCLKELEVKDVLAAIPK